MALGPYPDVTLTMARERHQTARRLLESGIDPMEQRKAEKAAEKSSSEGTFAKVAALWLEHWGEGVTARHAAYGERRLTADILPTPSARPIDQIAAPEILALVKAVEKRGAREIAKRVLETTSQIFRYAIAHSYATRNPAADVILRARKKENYDRVDAKELPGLLRAIESYQGKNMTRLAMKLLALTFVRTSEQVQARWSEVDLETARWDTPAERMKTNKPHIVPLSSQVVEILRTLRGMSDGELVFPGENDPKKPMSNNTILMALKRMGYQGEMTGHGFRGLASTLLHEHGFNHDHIDLQLAHTPRNAVSAAYNHALYLGPRTKMMQRWADYLERAQNGAKILPFAS